MKKIKRPNPAVMVVGGLGAFWIADIINPGFNPIGVMILLLIPILIVEFLFPQPELETIVEEAKAQALNVTTEEEVLAPGELVDDKETETAS